jgi:TonB-dependent receptor
MKHINDEPPFYFKTLILLRALFLFFVFSSGVFVIAQDTIINLNVKNLPLIEVLNQLEAKSGYSFLVRSSDVNLKELITINVSKKSVEEILVLLFEKRNIKFEITGKRISIYKPHIPQNSAPVAPPPAKRKISGVVLDENGQPVIGASVIIPDTDIGVATDLNGRFTLEAPSIIKIRISYLGYVAKEEYLNEISELKIVLEPTPQALKEVVITAQAKGQRQAILEQINSNTIKNVVAADRLQENPDANAAEAIGRLPGISVVRSGGEGAALVVRGLAPRYTSVTLNGIEMPSTSGVDRGTNLSGVSQYALQGAEVFKSLTADMDANSVAGTVNLKLRKIPKEFHVNFMAQKGYNNLNMDWGNYKYLAETSNRFFNNKLGVLFTGSLERVNRSVQTMNAGYGIQGSDPEGDILLNNIGLNDIYSINERRTALLTMDYLLTPNTSLMFYGMYNNSANLRQQQTKNYAITGAGSVSYNFSESPKNETDIFQTALSGESNFNLLNIKADYGIVYSKGKNYSTSRSWNFNFDKASSSEITDIEHRKKDPTEIVPLFSDDPDRLEDNWLHSFTTASTEINDKNLNVYLNFTLPFHIGDMITGNFKFGGMYRQKKRKRDDVSGRAVASADDNVVAANLLAGELDWITLNKINNITAGGISEGNNYSFLNGAYNFGTRFNFNRLNEISDTWERISNYYLAQGSEVYLPIFGDKNKVGYAQNVEAMVMNNQDLTETYRAGYLMSELNIGKYIMFLPGVRVEKINTTMRGFYAMPPTFSPNILDPLSGQDTTAVKSENYLLPMIHLRIKPFKSFFIHTSYTETLSRPDFNTISPNYFVNTGWSPFSYKASNPDLRAERWTNYDIQFTYHSNKIGLLSATLFYKNVQDMIWKRDYTRIKGDPIPDLSFPDNSVVGMSIWENHKYDAYLKGIEFDWQTSFYYLPKPFNFLTLSANYTITKSETKYPYTRMDLVILPGDRRPTQIRVDSVTTGPMVYQPKHIANISLGFNKGGFNVWLSYQYNGQIYTGKNLRAAPRLDTEKDYFNRWDLQLTQKFAIRKLKGFEVLANIANISDFMETQHHSGDMRHTYAESYGWTADLGLRFRF